MNFALKGQTKVKIGYFYPQQQAEEEVKRRRRTQ